MNSLLLEKIIKLKDDLVEKKEFVKLKTNDPALVDLIDYILDYVLYELYKLIDMYQ